MSVLLDDVIQRLEELANRIKLRYVEPVTVDRLMIARSRKEREREREKREEEEISSWMMQSTVISQR